MRYLSSGILQHKRKCNICALEPPQNHMINRYIIEGDNFKCIDSELNMLGTSVSETCFKAHRAYLPFLLDAEQYKVWYELKQVEIEKLRTSKKSRDKIRYPKLKEYLEKCSKILEDNVDIIQKKEESLKRIYNTILPEILESVLFTIRNDSEFKGFTGLAKMIDVLCQKALILEADIGNRLIAQKGVDETENGKENGGKYDKEKLLEIIRATSKEI